MTRAQILLLGDSLTQIAWEGWAGQLAHVYQRRADVINRGYSGYNTDFYLRLEDIAVENSVLTLVWFGANDAALPGLADHHHVPLERYSANLKLIVEKYRTKNMMLITPPPVHHGQRLEYQKQRYGDKATGKLERTLETTGLYAEACKSVAQELNIPCLDLYTLMSKEKDIGPYFYDGLHFSGNGHEVVFEYLLKAIGEHFPELKVLPCAATGQWGNSASKCSLPAHGPYHDEIDHTQIDEAFVTKK